MRHVHSPLKGLPRCLALAMAMLCVCLGWTLETRAADTSQELDKIERSLSRSTTRYHALERKADTVAAELESLKRQLVDLARQAQDHESMVSSMEAKTDDLRALELEKAQALSIRRNQLAANLAALQRLARHPPFALIALPAKPADTVRSAILLRHSVPRLENRARELNEELLDLAALREEIKSQRRDLEIAGRALVAHRKKLNRLIEAKLVLEQRTRSQSRSVQRDVKALSAQAKSLRELMDNLARADRAKRQSTAPPDTRSLPTANRQTARWRVPERSLPARGQIRQRFGERTRNGIDFKGVSIETRAAAKVVAPRSGTVVFAGPFDGYGQLLIIEQGEGYHILLAGLSRLDAAVGDHLLKGEPVGEMDAPAEGKPTLYIELRRKGQPINPLPWLAATRTKVNG